MKVKWLGHASFLITSKDGLKIITDPYTVGAGINYGKIEETADIVTVSHQHGDHNDATSVKGKPEILDAPGTRRVKGVDFKGIATHHDEAHGKQRGPNIIFCFTVDGIQVCHLGDLGHLLDTAKISEIGKVDVLFIPVGGTYTVDPQAASKICDSLNPSVVFPMHYKTARCDYPISGVDVFLKGRKNVRRLDSSEIEIRKEQLPSATETVVPKHAL